ncbi:hypothetical protein LPTSP4_34510 [Leptospira ryugenii]|uniref:Uncharacterized protein n=1 Tax=Leptospira ryugenii TaxID=1917863 RepID=A0A2P2E4W4_9LEPT|nr:hypothetical protein [Leptospira ryugenii]GBF51913.1 hypothetical protein LPTSP4_34510 [Leptospira ryugenii]
MAEKTDIHRKKISFYNKAIALFEAKDGVKNKARVHLKRANSLIREAKGDTGYKGEIALKVTHKPEYKKGQFDKAKADLNVVEPTLAELDSQDVALFSELKKILEEE